MLEFATRFAISPRFGWGAEVTGGHGRSREVRDPIYQIIEFLERQILEIYCYLQKVLKFPEQQILEFVTRFGISPRFGQGGEVMGGRGRSRQVGGGHDRSVIQHTKFQNVLNGKFQNSVNGKFQNLNSKFQNLFRNLLRFLLCCNSRLRFRESVHFLS